MTAFARRLARRTMMLGGAGLALLGCSPAGLLNGVSRIAGDGGVRTAVRGAAFGPDPRHKLDVYVPADMPAGARLPVVIFWYGGGWVDGSRGDYAFAGRAFAAQGFVAVIADYRLVPQVRFPSFVEDGALALKWARDNIGAHGGDPARIALSGHSAGAYIAAMLALDRHYLADTGVDPAIVRAAALLSGPYDFYPFTEPRGRDAMGQWPRPAETQPVSFARADAPPMLLMHGTADVVVRPGNSRSLAARLTQLGAPVELRLYPGKSHIDTIKSLSPAFRGSTPGYVDAIAFLRRNTALPTSRR
ncbi:MAG: alpha/beta hydrolase [Sphingomicrobium sp.]